MLQLGRDSFSPSYLNSHPVSYPVGTGAFFSGDKAAGA